jgi:addiction module RelE/StbE family toxin
MAKELVWSTKAKSDFQKITSYIASQSETYAGVFRIKVLYAIDKILDFPLLGRIVPEYKTGQLREVFIWNYRLVYLVSAKTIKIVTISHQKQQMNSKAKWIFY